MRSRKDKKFFSSFDQVFDTWGFGLGRVHKNFEQYGLYEECRNFNQHGIKGKNCLAKISLSSSEDESRLLDSKILSLISKFLVPSHSETALVGVCVPQVCSSHDLTTLGNTYLNDFGLKWNVHHCEKPLSYGFFEIFVMYVHWLKFVFTNLLKKTRL